MESLRNRGWGCCCRRRFAFWCHVCDECRQLKTVGMWGIGLLCIEELMWLIERKKGRSCHEEVLL